VKLGGIFRLTLPGKRRKEMVDVGGKPNQGTSKDQRLKANNPRQTMKPKAAPRSAKKK
jgi:hypothetical protein